MWKMLAGFIVFAVIAVFLLIKSGADVNMGGEQHGMEAVHAPEEAASPASAASAASAASGG